MRSERSQSQLVSYRLPTKSEYPSRYFGVSPVVFHDPCVVSKAVAYSFCFSIFLTYKVEKRHFLIRLIWLRGLDPNYRSK